ncbi:LysE family translocator [Ottowia sp.]|uniref:LysE family translocator n=1 Tax=Ottowia sp. TaxID=1898956 RepID=UPI003A83CC58
MTMEAGALLSLLTYAVATSITPGPNNMMLLALGLNFGFARSAAHMLGISLGFGLMVLVVGVGLGAALRAYPAIHEVLRWVGGAYMLYLAWRIATAAAPKASQRAAARPMGFTAAAAFQWVNPKAWIMALGAIATYLPSDPTVAAIAVLALVFTVVNLPCVSVWTAFGVGLQRLLTKPSYVHAFNITMALLLVLSLIPLIRA